MQPTIYAVGFGPGDVLHMTTQAVSVLETVDVIVGYTITGAVPRQAVSFYANAAGD